MKVFIVVFAFLSLSSISIGESRSNKKFLEFAFDKFLTDRDLNALLRFDDTLVVYLLKNEGYNILMNQLSQRNNKLIFKEAFKDSLVKRRLLILFNGPTEFRIKNDTVDQNIVYRSIKLTINYQFMENNKVSEVRLFDHTIQDTMNLEILDKLDEIKSEETKSTKDRSFFERYLEPSLIFTSSLMIVVLLFFVRSN